MPLQPLPILSGLERGDVVKFVLHLAETVKWGLQRCFLLAGKQLLGSGRAGWQATESRARVEEPLIHPLPCLLLLPKPSTRLPRPGAHLSLVGFSVLIGATRDRPQVDDQPVIRVHSRHPAHPLWRAPGQEPGIEGCGPFFLPPTLVNLGFPALPHMRIPVSVLTASSWC